MTGWGTFWTAVGALAAVGGVFVAIQSGSSAPVTSSSSSPPPVSAAPVESKDVATVRYDSYVYDDTCTCNEVRSIPAGAKVRLLCAASGATMTQGSRSSDLWYGVQGGYVSDVAVNTSSQYDPQSC